MKDKIEIQDERFKNAAILFCIWVWGVGFGYAWAMIQ